jgi:hypothetical protein
MISAGATRENGGARFFGALLASALINGFAWCAISMMALHFHETQQRENFRIAVARLRFEHKPPPTPTPSPVPTPRPRVRPKTRPNVVAAGPVTPPMQATISLPKNWQTTYLGSARVNDRDIRMWLDWKSQSAEFVPRVYLWHREIDALDPRSVSLTQTVQGVLAQLKNEGSVRFYASHAERACNGRYPAWYMSYDKLDGDPKIHIDDIFLIANSNVYRATYVRTLDEKEDATTVAALASLC